MRRHIDRYLALGWPLLAVEPGGKAPLGLLCRHGVLSATVDRPVIERWFRREPRANIGIRCSRFLVLDIDPRNGGEETVRGWVELHGRLPVTPCARTGSGGWHYLFAHPPWPVRGKAGRGVDVRSSNGYIVAPPSVTAAPYRWLRPPETTLAELPAWLQPLVRQEELQRVPVGDLQDVTLERRIERARAYLEHVDPAVQGQGGSAQALLAAQHAALGFALPEAAAMRALADWNARCQPPWSERELRHKVRQAISVGRTVQAGQHLRRGH